MKCQHVIGAVFFVDIDEIVYGSSWEEKLKNQRKRYLHCLSF